MNCSLKVLNNPFSREGTSLYLTLLYDYEFGESLEYAKGRLCFLPRSRAHSFLIEEQHNNENP